MAIKISGTTVIDDSRNIDNIGTACATCWFGDGSNITNLPSNPLVLTPINTSPADGATGLFDNATLCASTYYSLYGITMCCSQWQVDDNSDFSSPVFNICQAGTSTQTTLTSGTLCTSCTYYWRVRYFDNCGCCSDYSNPTCFTTLSSFLPTTLGESYGGGYYAGAICAAGTCYVLIVAPNSTGCIYGCAWKTSNTSSFAGTGDLCNGYSITYTSLDNSDHPAGNWTATRTIGGYSDWYLPARQEYACILLCRACLPNGERFPAQDHLTANQPGGALAAYQATTVCRAYIIGGECGSGYGFGIRYKTGSNYITRAIRRVPF